MNDSLNNKELVAVGHQFAKAMSSDTPIIDMAKMFTRLAERLDCTTAALREMTKDRDAEHGDVLTWEKTMFKACGEDGPKSVADKFAELQAKCAALAAENAGLKTFGDKLSEMHNDLNGEGTGIQGRAEVACQQVALEAAMEEFDAIKTTSTDAFLAEVRNEASARAVELFAQTLGSPYAVRDEKCYEDGFTRAIEIVRGAQAPRFAAQFRKGVQS